MANATKAPKKPIALVGLPGAGKSTVGKVLAKRLGLPFIDTDREIEAAAGLSVAEIFERFGEPHFRESERQAMARLVEGPPRVIATGGGAFIDDETRALILERCTAVWLDVAIDTLVQRASRRDHRPLLNGKDCRTTLQTLAEARNPVYAKAHLTVRSSDVAEIVAALAGL